MITLAALALLAVMPTGRGDVAGTLAARIAVAEDAAALAELREMGTDAVSALLVEGGRQQGDGRRRIVAVLAALGPDAYEQIGKAAATKPGLYSENWAVGADAVREMGEPVLPVVIAAFGRTQSGQTDAFATKVLERFGGTAVPYLLRLLEREPDPVVRTSSISLLALAKSDAGADVLARAADGSDSEQRRFGLLGLTELRDPRAVAVALRMVRDSSQFIRAAAASTLFTLEPGPAHRVTLATLARSDPHILVRRVAASALRGTSDPVSQALGRRYDPLNMSPVAQPALERRRALLVILAGAIALAASVAAQHGAALIGSSRRGVVTRVLAGVVILALGWHWGRNVEGVRQETEYLFLALSGLGVLGPRVRLGAARTESTLSQRRSWIIQLVLLLLGTFLGWMQLWGFSFEWVALFTS